MAKLLIFRGETLHREVELTEQTVRIGRTSQNDQNQIVLEDPSKGVSRTHAEIRFEGDHHVLVDLGSQNGTWVSGSRVSSVVLEPGVVASVGPFRLMIETPAPAASAYTAETIAFEPVPAESAAPLPGGDQGEISDTTTEPRQGPPGPAKARHWYVKPRTWVIGGAATVLLAALGFAAFTVAQKKEPAFDLALARVMVDGGNCPQALAEHIEPALSANPGDAEALELRRRCSAPPPQDEPAAPGSPPAPDPAAMQELDEADTLIAAHECAQALDKVNAVLAGDPANERAQQLLLTATACISPVSADQPKRVPTDVLAVRESPARGGLDLLPKELDKDYQKRKLAARKRYDEAVSMLQRREYVDATREFELLAQQVPDGYLELAERRAEAIDGLQREAARAHDLAREAEKAGDFDAALEAYGRAHALDPSIQVDAAVQRIQNQKRQRGQKRCEEAKLAFSYGDNAAAAAAFQDVLRLLPSSDPCHALARDRLRQLGK